METPLEPETENPFITKERDPGHVARCDPRPAANKESASFLETMTPCDKFE